MRNATPSRADDPALQFVAGVVRNEPISENTFKKRNHEIVRLQQRAKLPILFHHSRRYRGDEAARVSQLRPIVENHFYISVRSDQGTDVPMGGPYQPPKP